MCSPRPLPLREVHKNPRSLSMSRVLVGFCCHERGFCCYEGVVAVVVTRVEQKVVAAANVSLLALYKKGKSDPDPPPSTPTIHHPSSATNLESHTCDWGPNQRPLSGAAAWSTPFLRRPGTHPNSDPQLVSLLGCEGPIKNSGFIFICVCVCVWARL